MFINTNADYATFKEIISKCASSDPARPTISYFYDGANNWQIALSGWNPAVSFACESDETALPSDFTANPPFDVFQTAQEIDLPAKCSSPTFINFKTDYASFKTVSVSVGTALVIYFTDGGDNWQLVALGLCNTNESETMFVCESKGTDTFPPSFLADSGNYGIEFQAASPVSVPTELSSPIFVKINGDYATAKAIVTKLPDLAPARILYYNHANDWQIIFTLLNNRPGPYVIACVAAGGATFPSTLLTDFPAATAMSHKLDLPKTWISP